MTLKSCDPLHEPVAIWRNLRLSPKLSTNYVYGLSSWRTTPTKSNASSNPTPTLGRAIEKDDFISFSSPLRKPGFRDNALS